MSGDRPSLRRVVIKNKKTTAAKVTLEMNVVLTNPVSTKTVSRELHKRYFLLVKLQFKNHSSVMIMSVTGKSGV